ncbi:MAG: 4-(cytidine 5'-diphospho)-2-C-methyl-D-erythritol kinase [Flavobacteriales bacterium]|nr:4-(cytidine 5'-diphospho)-2-C-methyl-D-erythritol kinase [Flavobacteriales bacterium]
MIYYPNAKINLGLNVLNRRPDGFHNLETVFYPVPLCDIIEVTEKQGGRPGEVEFSAGGFPISGDGSNLCVKAFESLAKDCELPFTRIHLYKRIPMGAGLGGGSSDAAHTLVALNYIYDLGLRPDDLVRHAAQIGSDCAFFIKNEPVFATRRGDCFHETHVDLSGWNLVLVYPNIHVGTAEAYACVDKHPDDRGLRRNIEQPVEEWRHHIYNDFEGSVFPLHPQIDLLKDKLYEVGAVYASMSGSGSTCFGLFKEEIDLSVFDDYFTWQGKLLSS